MKRQIGIGGRRWTLGASALLAAGVCGALLTLPPIGATAREPGHRGCRDGRYRASTLALAEALGRIDRVNSSSRPPTHKARKIDRIVDEAMLYFE